MSQLVHPQRHQQTGQQDASEAATDSMRAGSAPELPAGQHNGGASAAQASAFERLGPSRPGAALLLQSLPADISQKQSVFGRLNLGGPQAGQFALTPSEQQQQQQQLQRQAGSVFDRLAGGGQQSHAAQNGGGSVWQRLAAPGALQQPAGGSRSAASFGERLPPLTLSSTKDAGRPAMLPQLAVLG